MYDYQKGDVYTYYYNKYPHYTTTQYPIQWGYDETSANRLRILMRVCHINILSSIIIIILYISV